MQNRQKPRQPLRHIHRLILCPFQNVVIGVALALASYDTRAFAKKGWPTQTQLAWPILGVRHFADINRALLLEAGASLNLAKGTAVRLLENLRSRAVQQAEALYAEVETENARIAHARPDELEVWFACPRPDYPAALLAQLGRVRFGMPSNQLRFSSALLDKPLPMHNPTAKKPCSTKAASTCWK